MKRSLVKFSGAFFIHLIGWLSVASATLLIIAEPGSIRVLAQHLSSQTFVEYSVVDLGFFLAITATMWVFIYLVIAYARSAKQKISVVRATGTVLTETLIALPVLLMLVSGLIQLSINNIGGILANVAVFQASRAAHLWVGEAENGRGNVTLGMATERSRIVAASVMTPVASGDYMVDLLSGSPTFMQARAAFVANQLPIISGDTGALGFATVFLLQAEDVGGILDNNISMARSFDRTTFRLRTVRKFTMAYHGTQVMIDAGGSDVRTRMIYSHFIGMPFVGRVFGTLGSVGGRSGYFTAYERELVLPRALDAFPDFPTP